jgi:hypothetical protein
MRRALGVLVLGAVLFGLCGSARAEDRIVLENGSVVSGKVVRISRKVVVIEVDGLGRVRIPREEVLRIKTGDTPPVRTGDPVEPEEPAPPENDPLDTPFKDLVNGQTVLLSCKSEDRGAIRCSGRRVVAKVEVAGASRIKILLDPTAGVLGYAWVPQEEVERAVPLDGHPERRILLIEGMETSAWVRGKLTSGTSFSGRLDRLAPGDKLELTSARSGELFPTEVPLSEVREIEAVSRGEPLIRALAVLEPGEPVRIRTADREDPIEGRWLGQEGHFLRIETMSGYDSPPSVVSLFRGAPITEIEMLPERLRGAFKGISLGDALTVTTVVVGEKSVVRRTMTGKLASASLESLSISTLDGLEEFPIATISSLVRPREDLVESLMARKEASAARTVLSVMPGMRREEVAELLGKDEPGITLLYAGDVVDKVYLRPPFQGPIFGIELGGSYRAQSRETDLVFDTVEEPLDKAGGGQLILSSHTLKGLAVKLYVSGRDLILAMEVARLE